MAAVRHGDSPGPGRHWQPRSRLCPSRDLEIWLVIVVLYGTGHPRDCRRRLAGRLGESDSVLILFIATFRALHLHLVTRKIKMSGVRGKPGNDIKARKPLRDAILYSLCDTGNSEIDSEPNAFIQSSSHDQQTMLVDKELAKKSPVSGAEVSRLASISSSESSDIMEAPHSICVAPVRRRSAPTYHRSSTPSRSPCSVSTSADTSVFDPSKIRPSRSTSLDDVGQSRRPTSLSPPRGSRRPPPEPRASRRSFAHSISHSPPTSASSSAPVAKQTSGSLDRGYLPCEFVAALSSPSPAIGCTVEKRLGSGLSLTRSSSMGSLCSFANDPKTPPSQPSSPLSRESASAGAGVLGARLRPLLRVALGGTRAASASHPAARAARSAQMLPADPGVRV